MHARAKNDYELMIVGPAEQLYCLVSFIISKLRSKKLITWGEGWVWSKNACYLRAHIRILSRIENGHLTRTHVLKM